MNVVCERRKQKVSRPTEKSEVVVFRKTQCENILFRAMVFSRAQREDNIV